MLIAQGALTRVVSTAELDEYLRLDVSAPVSGFTTTFLEQVIDAATDAVQGWINQILPSGTYTYASNGFGDGTIPGYPVTSIDTVQYLDSAGVLQNYTTFTAVLRGIQPAIVPDYNTVFPTVQDMPESVTYTLTAGYGTAIPEGLKFAVMRMASEMLENTEMMTALPGLNLAAKYHLESYVWRHAGG